MSLRTLSFFSVIRVTGTDARTFLTGQMTNRMPADGQVSLFGYANPKGRLFASAYALCLKETFYLLTEKSNTDAFIKRLKMFVLRSDVHFLDITETSELTWLDAQSVTDTLSVNTLCAKENQIFFRLSDTQAQAPFVTEIQRFLRLSFDVTPSETLEKNNNEWQASEIMAGIAHVSSATKEAFVPQHINLELVHGLVFDKGCYPGQEVISRVEHLGSIQRRAKILLAQEKLSSTPGETLYAEGQEVGTVVNVAHFENATLIFASLEKKKTLDKTVENAQGIPFTLLNLSYGFKNLITNEED